MAVVAQREQPLRRRLRRAAHVAERPGAAAVAGVLQLADDAVGIAEASSAVPSFAPFMSGPRDSTSAFIGPIARCAFSHAARRERGERAIDVEAFDAEAVVRDARRRAARPPARSRGTAGPAPMLQQRHRALTSAHRHAEQPLVEIDRALDVGHGEPDVVDPAHAQRRRGRLREQARREARREGEARGARAADGVG